MPYNTYPYELPPLPYPHDALEPYIDAETMHYHHDKHFQTYINNLNKALQPYPKLQKLTLEQLLSNPRMFPQRAYTDISNNGGGVYNHMMYFEGLRPAGEGRHAPDGVLLTLINRTFGSFDAFKKVFSSEALDVFGSGYACLAFTPQKALKIVKLKNQDTVLASKSIPILLFDVWEHAYYLKHKNLRADYVNAIWNVVTFPAL